MFTSWLLTHSNNDLNFLKDKSKHVPAVTDIMPSCVNTIFLKTIISMLPQIGSDYLLSLEE